MRRAVGILLLAAVLHGCPTYTAKPYSPSAANAAALRRLDTKINVGPFTSLQPDLGEMTCGAVGPITTPDGETYGVFIRKALVDELKSAAAFSERAPITLTAFLNEIGASPTAGTWSLSLTLNSSNGQSLTVKEQYTFTPSWNAYTACQQTAQALGPAVQDLIAALVRHPEFRRLIE